MIYEQSIISLRWRHNTEICVECLISFNTSSHHEIEASHPPDITRNSLSVSSLFLLTYLHNLESYMRSLIFIIIFFLPKQHIGFYRPYICAYLKFVDKVDDVTDTIALLSLCKYQSLVLNYALSYIGINPNKILRVHFSD